MNKTMKKTTNTTSNKGIGMTASRLLVYMLAFTMTSQPLMAQVQVDQNAAAANQAQIDQAANGVPVVNIANPSAAGVSRNEFVEFNVGREGLIFNNSREVTDTQLSGFISGNPQLNREATIILNEVNGANRSQLNGFAEIAGPGANLIIANPNGITCDGCGFINTPRTTLTTGDAQLSNGALTGFNVDRGDISIEGAGLNATGTDQLDLLSRAINLNAELQGNQVNAVLGRNQVDYDDLSASELEDDGSDLPLFALDASALGALRAGQIRLIGTEKGVGINIPTDVASAGGDIQISADGRLVLGNINATGDVELTSDAESVEVTDLAFGQNVNVNAATDIVTSADALVAATESITLESQTLNQQGDLVAGLNRDGTLNEVGQLSVTTQTLDNSGQVQATESLNVNAQTLNNTGQVIVEQAQIDAQTLNNQGDVNGQNLNITADIVNNDLGNINAGDASIQSNQLTNIDGSIEAQNFAITVQDNLDNSSGVISQLNADQSLTTLNAGELRNDGGSIQSSGQRFDVQVDGQISNTNNGQILHSGTDALGINAASLDNSNEAGQLDNGIIQSNADLNVELSGDLNNQNGRIVGQQLNLASQEINNTQGVIVSLADEAGTSSSIQGTTLINNNGSLQTNNNDLTLEFDSVANSGENGVIVHAGSGELNIIADTVSNTDNASILSSGSVVLTDTTELINNDQSVISAEQGLDAQVSGDISNQNGRIDAQSLTLSAVTGSIDNTNGEIIQFGDDDQQIDAQSLSNTVNGSIQSNAENLTLNADSVDNSGGQVLHGGSGTLTVTGDVITNEGGAITNNSTILIDTNNGLLDNNSGQITGSDVTVNSADIRNTSTLVVGGQTVQGVIEGGESLALDATNSVDNTSGVLRSIGVNSTTSISAGNEIDNTAGVIETNNESLTVTADQLINNDGGRIQQTGQDGNAITNIFASVISNINQGLIAVADFLSIDGAEGIDNTDGQIQAGELALSTQGELNNSSGLISQIGNSDQTINAQTITNQQGGIIESQANSLAINTDGDINNQDSTIVHLGDGSLDINAQDINNQQGALISNGVNNITLSGELQNSDTLAQTPSALRGVIGNEVVITAQGVDNTLGLIQSNTQLSVDAQTGDIDNAGGAIIASGIENGFTSSLNAQTITNNTGGVIQVNNDDLELAAVQIDNSDGQVIHAGSGDLTLNAQTELNNTDGRLLSNGSVDISNNPDLETVDNTDGEISAIGRITIFARNILNNLGLIETSVGDIEIAASESFENNNGQNPDQNAQIISGNNLIIDTDTVVGDGVLQAANALDLTTTSFNNNSDLRAGVNLIIRTADFINESGGVLTSDGSLTFDLSGDFVNNSGGLVSALNDINIAANTLTNNGNLTIGRNGFFTITQGVINTGTLTATESFDVSANSFDNTGAFGSGGDLLLRADDIRNTAGAAIFVGGTASLLGQTLLNQEADIFVTENLLFAADVVPDNQAGVFSFLSASNVENISGTIETLQGNIDLFTENLVNRRLQFETEERRVSAVFSIDCIDCSRTSFETNFIIREEFATVVISDSAQAQLVAGGDLQITSEGDVLNQFSLLAANNNLTIEADRFFNEGVSGTAREVITTFNVDESDSFIENIIEEFAILNGRFAPIALQINNGTRGVAAGRNIVNNALAAVPGVEDFSVFTVGMAETGNPLIIGEDDSIDGFGRGLLRLDGNIPGESETRFNLENVGSISFRLNPNFEMTRVGTIATVIPASLNTNNSDITRVSVVQNPLTQTLNPNLEAAFAGNETVSAAFLNNILLVPVSEANGVSTVQAGNLLLINAQEINNGNVNRVSNAQAIDIVDSLQPTSSTGGNALITNQVDQVDNADVVSTPDVVTDIDVNDVSDNQTDVNVDATPVDVNVDVSVDDLTDFMAVNPVQDPDFQFPGGNGLFVFNSDPNSNFLIETNPAFTQLSNFVSSDFFLERLGFSPDDAVRRLGDSFYEARLIQDSILNATGARFLSANFTNQNDQLEYLYDNAIASQEALSLSVGIGLTAAQVASLTHDIVWLEEQTITAPDGQQVTVLAPVLYLANVRPNQLQSNGALLAGSNVNLISSGNLVNSGQVNSANDVVAQAGQNIVNLGTLNTAGNLQLTAGNSVLNRSVGSQDAIISAGNNINITAINGDIRSERTVSSVTQDTVNNTFQFDFLSGDAAIRSGSNVTLDAANDIGLIGSSIDAQGGVILDAGRDVNIGSLEQRSDYSNIGDKSRHIQEQVTNVGSSVSGDNVGIISANDVTISGSGIDATNNIAINAGNDVTIESVADRQYNEVYNKSSHSTREEIGDRVTNQGSELNAGNDVAVNSGNDLKIKGSDVGAGNNILLTATGDTTIESAEDSQYAYFFYEKEGSFGSKKGELKESQTITNVGANIIAGNDISINAQANDDGSISVSDSGSVLISGGNLNAGDQVTVSGSDVTVQAKKDLVFEREEKFETGFGGLSSSASGRTSSEELISNSQINTGERDLSLISGSDISVIASDLMSGGNINLQAVDDILISADLALSEVQEFSEESSFLSSFDSIYEKTEKRSGTRTSTVVGSNISAGGNVNINGGRATVAGSNIDAGDNINVRTDIGDIIVQSVESNTESYSNETTIKVGLGDVVKQLTDVSTLTDSFSDGQAKFTIAEATYDKVDSQTSSTEHTGSQLTAGNNINLDSVGDITISGSDVIADSDLDNQGDVSLIADGDVSIVETSDSSDTQTEETHGRGELSFVVQHQAVEVAKAAEAVKDAKDQVKDAEESYRKYEKDLDRLKDTRDQLKSDYDNKVPGIAYQDIVELNLLIGEVESDEEFYLTSIALSAANLVSKVTLLTQQTAAAAASVATYGFNAGVQLDLSASTTETETHTETSRGSVIAGNNITIRTGGDEIDTEFGDGESNIANTSTNIRGSELYASDTIDIETGELTIEASQDNNSSVTNTEQASIRIAQTVYGAAAGGPTVSADYSRSQAKDNDTTINNSILRADNINLSSTGDTTINGANINADNTLNVDVGNDLLVQSQQNRYSASNNSFGISGGFSLGASSDSSQNSGSLASSVNNIGQTNGSVGSVNAGINASNGRTRTSETVLTDLTGQTVNINVGNNTAIVGASIAAVDENGVDNGQLDLTTRTLDFADLRNTNYNSQQSAGISTSVGISSTGAGSSAEQQAFDASGNRDLSVNTSNVTFNDTSSFSLGKSLATLGEGNITVTDDDANGTDSLERLNRDVENTNKDLFSVDRTRGDVDLTIDTRLLSEDGRQDIANNVTDTKEFGEDVIRAVNTTTTDSEVNGLGGFYKALNNNVNVTALKNDIDRNPEHDELRAKLDNKENTEVYFEGLRELSALAKNKFGIEPGELILFNGDQTTSASLQDVIASNGQVLIDTKGATTFDGTNFIDVSDADSKLDQVTTLGNELLRSAEVDGSTDLSTSSNSNTQNALSDAFGTQFGDRVDQLFEGGLDNGVSASFYNSQSSSASAVSGTQRANEVGNDAVLYRQLAIREISIIESIADDYARDNGIDGDAARRELTQTALSLVDKKWSELNFIKETTDNAIIQERALEALNEAVKDQGPLVIDDHKETALFGRLTNDGYEYDADFGNQYLLADELSFIEEGAYIGDDRGGEFVTASELDRYISQYGLPEGVEPLPLPSSGEVVGQVYDNYETVAVSVDGKLNESYGNPVYAAADLTIDVVENVVNGVGTFAGEFVGNCVTNGTECLLPKIVTDGGPSDRILVDRLQQDQTSLVGNVAGVAQIVPDTIITAAGVGAIRLIPDGKGSSSSTGGNGPEADINTSQFVEAPESGLNFNSKIENGEIDVTTNQKFVGGQAGAEIKDTKFDKAFLFGRFDSDAGNLFIRNMGVDQGGNKIGTELISNAIQSAGVKNVKSVTAQLSDTNKAVFAENIAKGLSADDAFKLTPLGKSLDTLGFKNLTAEDTVPFPLIKATFE